MKPTWVYYWRCRCCGVVFETKERDTPDLAEAHTYAREHKCEPGVYGFARFTGYRKAVNGD